MLRSPKIYYFLKMELKVKILDIAMNLNRIGNWAADDFERQQKRIYLFLDQTSNYLNSIKQKEIPSKIKTIFKKFLNEYSFLEKEAKQGPKDRILWAEKMMTWGNILTHRSQLIK